MEATVGCFIRHGVVDTSAYHYLCTPKLVYAGFAASYILYTHKISKYVFLRIDEFQDFRGFNFEDQLFFTKVTY